ncbi:MAG: hypothetical protein NVS1B4_26910 [Gemmatimonadaceae bacterium]
MEDRFRTAPSLGGAVLHPTGPGSYQPRLMTTSRALRPTLALHCLEDFIEESPPELRFALSADGQRIAIVNVTGMCLMRADGRMATRHLRRDDRYSTPFLGVASNAPVFGVSRVNEEGVRTWTLTR